VIIQGLAETDLEEAATKALGGDLTGAAATLAGVLAGLASGHPLIGVMVAVGAEKVARAFVDQATARLEKAEREHDAERDRVIALTRELRASVDPLFARSVEEIDARESERFLQTLRYVDRNVASAAGQLEIAGDVRRILALLQTQATTSLAPNAAFFEASELAKELREYLASERRRLGVLVQVLPRRLESRAIEGLLHIRQQARIVDEERWLLWTEDKRRRDEQDRQAGRSVREDEPGTGNAASSERAIPRRRESARAEPPPPIEWDEQARALHGQTVVLGDPGFGKTVFALAEFEHFASLLELAVLDQQAPLEVPGGSRALEPDVERFLGSAPLPIFVRLAELGEQSLDEAIQSQLARWSTLRRSYERWTELGCLAIILDGLDEVPSHRRPVVRRQVIALLQSSVRASRLLVTSRSVGYEPLSAPGLSTFELLGFEWDLQVPTYVRAWFGGDGARAERLLQELATRPPSVQGLTRVPLLLGLICKLFDSEHAIPERRSALLREALEAMVQDRSTKRLESELDGVAAKLWDGARTRPEQALEICAEVARAQFEASEGGLTVRGARKVVQERIPELRARARERIGNVPLLFEQSTELLEELVLHCGVFSALGEGERAPLVPVHRSLLESLTAAALAAEGWERIRRQVNSFSYLPGYEEIVILLAGELDAREDGGAAKLLKLLAQAETDDDHRHRLALALACISEVRGAQREREAVALEAFDCWWRSRLADRPWKHLERNLRTVGSTRDAGPIAVHRLLSILTDRTVQCGVREGAAHGLGELDPAASVAFDALRRVLEDKTEIWALRRCVASVLGKFGPAAVAPLRRVLWDKSEDGLLRHDAAGGLSNVRPATSSAFDALYRILEDKTEDVFDHTDNNLRHDIVYSLRNLGGVHPRALEVVCHALGNKEESPGLRSNAIFVFIDLGSSAPSVVVDTLRHLILDESESSELRQQAAGTLGKLGAAACPAVGALVRVLSDRTGDDRSGDPVHSRLRREIAAALGQLVPVCESAVLTLMGILTDRNEERMVRLCAFAAMHPPMRLAPRVLDVLCTVLKDSSEDDEWRTKAAHVIGRFGSAASPAVAALRGVLISEIERGEASAGSTRGQLRAEVAGALGTLGWPAYPSLREELLAILSDRREILELRVAVAKALVQRGPMSGPVVDSLRAVLTDRQEPLDLRIAVSRTLKGLGLGAAPLVTALQAILADREEEVRLRAHAADAVAPFDEATSQLLGLLADATEPTKLREGVAVALADRGPESLPALTFLRAIAENEQSSLDQRSLAACSLGKLGDASPGTVDLLLFVRRRGTNHRLEETAARLLVELANRELSAADHLYATAGGWPEHLSRSPGDADRALSTLVADHGIRFVCGRATTVTALARKALNHP
jgi:hypothetical protein